MDGNTVTHFPTSYINIMELKRMMIKRSPILTAVAIFCLATATLVADDKTAKKESVYDNGKVPVNTVESARLMLEDLVKTYGDEYKNGRQYLNQLADIEAKLAANQNDNDAKAALATLIKKAALENPLLDFDKILVLKRNPAHGWGFPGLNAYTNMTIDKSGWDNEICILSDLRSDAPKLTPIYRHEAHTSLIRDMDLHFSGKKLMFSAADGGGRWGVFEIDTDGKNLRQLTPGDQADVDWFDSTYLAEDGQIVACSTAGMQGLPCENGSRQMTNIYRVDTQTKAARQLTFEQDSDWHPTMLPNGRVMYLRWEYTDIPHYFSRILFSMNPDGTKQVAMWGSGSCFPTAYKHARPVPGHGSLVVGVVGGHHAEPESGRLLLVDPQMGEGYPFKPILTGKEWGPEDSELNIMTKVFPKEVTGCVQEIPGHGRDVFGNVYDNQGGESTIRFVYPYPLSDKYFLVNVKKPGNDWWGVWLVDVFDNMTLIKELPGEYALFEPTPLRETPRPPVLPDFTNHDDPDGTIFITDVNLGRGIKGVPKGVAKQVRVFAYHYGYNGSGGHESVGQESSWDVKRILGTAKVEDDGSVCFKVPANTPIAFHILDEDGAALQLMRSWTVAMPGEKISCVGCHERPNDAVPALQTQAARKAPQELKPWYGPARAWGYEVEIQPMLEKYCVTCHNDENAKEKGVPSFVAHNTGNWQSDTSYAALNPYVRRPGPEFELEMLNPMEYHASTSELIQRLKKGHHGVELDAEAWDRLYTWIDLNAPYRGMWNNPGVEKRRKELQEIYAYHTANPEEEYREALANRKPEEIERITPAPQPKREPDALTLPDFPFTPAQAKAMVGGELEKKTMKLADGVEMTFVRIPAGEFIMGSQPDTAKYADEIPRAVVKIAKPFWMSETEVTNAQFATYDPDHDTRYHKEDGKDHIVPGYIANHPDQPVSRVTWQESRAFTKWLSDKCGVKADLPTEAQWEWAARAGSGDVFYYGNRDTDFSKFANLAGAELRRTYTNWDGGSKVHIRRHYPEGHRFPLRDDRFEDKWIVSDYVKQYAPNAWGLYDMIGNAAEWTRSSYAPYPYRDDDGRNDGDVAKPKVVRGGSWSDRPAACGSAVRKSYPTWQKVFDVGVRVIIEE